HLLDLFVENFVLEIKVHFGMQHIELMHMCYALDLAVLAVGVRKDYDR
ncbi:unnamed protein product, partial [Prunus brigantina]